MVRLSVVIPTYNEAGHITDLLADVSGHLAGIDHEIVVVDDDSPDGTHARVAEYAQGHPHVVPVLRTGEKGLATAVIAGIRRAKGDFVAVMDSDYQHPPEALPRLLKAAEDEDADLVAASRYVEGGSDQGFNPVRRVISWGARLIAKTTLTNLRRHGITDPMTGLFLVRRDRVPLDALRPRGYKILLEILGRAELRRVTEVGYAFGARRAGQSKLGLGTQVDFLLHVARLAMFDRENRRFALFAFVGATGAVVNVAVLALFIEVLRFNELGIVRYNGETLLVGTLIAGVIGREAGALWNFAWNDLITFKDKRRVAHAGYWHRLFRFHVVTIWSFVIYVVVFYPLVLVRVHYILAALLAIAAGFIVNYVGNHRWTYARRRDAHDA